MGLGFAVGTRGADHNRSGAYQVDFSESVNRRRLRAEDVHHVVATEDQAAILDSAIFCKFLRGVFSDLYVEGAEYLRLVTGWDISADELQQTARRIVTVKKLFNVRAGWQPSEDTLPARLLQQPQADDAESHISASQLQELVYAYNVARGWTQEGWIPAELIEQLGLEDVHASPVTPDAARAAR